MLPMRAKVEMVEREGLTIQERYALIETVRNFPAVWDDRNVDYKDPIKRAQSWTMIMHEMVELTARTMKVEELSRVFKNLRDTFRREKREHREHLTKVSGASTSDSHSRIREWPFYESLSYLDPVVDRGTRYSNAPQDVDVLGVEEVETRSDDMSLAYPRFQRVSCHFSLSQHRSQAWVHWQDAGRLSRDVLQAVSCLWALSPGRRAVRNLKVDDQFWMISRRQCDPMRLLIASRSPGWSWL